MTVTALALGLVSGLALASIYVLIGLSFTTVLAVSGVFNFAQGSIVMLGAILAFVLGVRHGMGPLIAGSLTIILGMLAGMCVYYTAVRPAIGRSHAFTHTTMLTTIGLGTGVNALAVLLFGGNTEVVPSYVSENPIALAGIPVRPIYILMIATGLFLTLGIEWLIRKTSLGKMFRATLEDPEGARVLGINPHAMWLGCFAAAGAMSGIAGFLAAPVIGASAYSAQQMAFFGFAGMAIGGFGSFLGTLVGGVIVGLLSGLVQAAALPDLTVPVVWVVVVVVLILKPAGLWGVRGLFGAAGARDV